MSNAFALNVYPVSLSKKQKVVRNKSPRPFYLLKQYRRESPPGDLHNIIEPKEIEVPEALLDLRDCRIKHGQTILTSTLKFGNYIRKWQEISAFRILGWIISDFGSDFGEIAFFVYFSYNTTKCVS